MEVEKDLAYIDILVPELFGNPIESATVSPNYENETLIHSLRNKRSYLTLNFQAREDPSSH